MKLTRKLISLLLAAALLAGLFVGLTLTASATGGTGVTSSSEKYTDLQRAVVETALAYHNRGHNVQYDSVVLTIQAKYSGEEGADLRETDFTSPEDATADNLMYSVCSAYCFEVYYDAFNYQILGNPLKAKTNGMCNIPADDPICVVKYDATGTDPSSKVIKDQAEAIEAAKKALQPGDIIVGYGDTGHAMLYIGDYKGDGTKYMAHCWGGKYDIDTAQDKVEKYTDANSGAIRVQDAIYGCFTKGGSPWDLWASKHGQRFVILRPLNVLKASDLTENAKGRLKYPGINIDRTASVSRFGAVEKGGDVTVTIAVENYSEKPYTGLPVTEKIPAGGALKAGSITGGGTESGGTVKWNLNVPAGETVTVSYTVTATGNRGDTLDFSEGSVGGIRSNKIPIRIGGKGLTDEQVAKLKDIEKSKNELQGKNYTGEQFVSAAYTMLLGIDPQVPVMTEFMKNAFDRQKIEGATSQMFVKKETVPAEFAKADAMLVPLYFGGTLVKTGGNGHARVLDVANQDYLQPGDVVMGGSNIFSGKNSNLNTYIYLGDNKVAYLDKDKLKVGDANKSLVKLLSYETFAAFRPSQAYDDMTVEAKAGAKLPFTDVTEADWFYTYVKDLYNDGTVNGMTPTTFVPKGNLTYGQALKLIVCALGNGEQASTGGHWASGYLKFAQDKGWIAGDVDLNGNVTRLAFCQIAAKAKNLTEQPATNPFKDTNDTAVLALNKAGVINGMSADTFDPSGLLTRAQISKIIHTLRGV
ncbi:MAG: S-layer homology domain-containing protein [Oscillospiraceae bacterium]|nr:S-layer homology domain-containing protein [Oscillospiraceae bacterium]